MVYINIVSSFRPVRFEDRCNPRTSACSYLNTTFYDISDLAFNKQLTIDLGKVVFIHVKSLWGCMPVYQRASCRHSHLCTVPSPPLQSIRETPHAHWRGPVCGTQLPETIDILKSTGIAFCRMLWLTTALHTLVFFLSSHTRFSSWKPTWLADELNEVTL